MKLNWGSETSPLLLFWKENLSLARLSKSLQEILLKKSKLSLSNSVVTRIGDRAKAVAVAVVAEAVESGGVVEGRRGLRVGPGN
ncbi:hypothetical protein L1049_017266 [Liquidambar formosana]|uniref:Uncharacterized protein n=1 Tax=Liquidambar formosana TaxID=63359 RepID=A0AAP0S0M5_LIQFO